MNPSQFFNMSFDLSPARVARHIDHQFPDLAPSRPKYLGEGYDTVAYELESGWVFRFAKRPERVKLLMQEARLMKLLAPRLPLRVVDPAYIAEALEDGGACIGYKKIGGVCCADFNGETNTGRLAAEMGGFLTALHATPLEGVISLGIGDGKRALLPDGGMDELRQKAESIMPRLELETASTLRHFLATFEEPDFPPAPLSLVHADLTAVHMWLKPQGNNFSGIIDFGDACLGHPMFDFTGLLAWFGEDFVREALKHYQGAVDERHLPWIRKRAVVYGVMEVEAALKVACPQDMQSGMQALRQAL